MALCCPSESIVKMPWILIYDLWLLGWSKTLHLESENQQVCSNGRAESQIDYAESSVGLATTTLYFVWNLEGCIYWSHPYQLGYSYHWQTVGTLESNKSTKLLHPGAIMGRPTFASRWPRHLQTCTAPSHNGSGCYHTGSCTGCYIIILDTKGVEACYKALHCPFPSLRLYDHVGHPTVFGENV